MRFAKPKRGYVLRPSVTVALGWFGGLAMWGLYQMAVAKYPTDLSVEFRLITLQQYLGVSALHLALLVWFVLDARAARKSGLDVRRGQLLGLTIAVLVLLIAQYGAHVVYGPLNR